ncbi:hypothetical protein Tco_0607048 [Tanacetum coccineum]
MKTNGEGFVPVKYYRGSNIRVFLSFRHDKRKKRFTTTGFLTLTPLPGQNVGELPPITAFTFTTRSPNNTPLTNHASTSANPNLVISPAFIEATTSEEYDEEREMEPRPVRVREATHVLRTGSLRARRHRGRVVEFEEAPNRDGSRVERESEGRRPLERRVEEGGP